MVRGGKGKRRGQKLQDDRTVGETINGYAVSYVQRMVKCNKPLCKKCKQPGGGHGPYWYKIYRTANGKVKTKYHGKVEPDA